MQSISKIDFAGPVLFLGGHITQIAVFIHFLKAAIVGLVRRDLGNIHNFGADGIHRITKAPFQPVLQECRVDADMRIAYTLVAARSLKEGGKGLK